MEDERGRAGQTIKTSTYANGPSAVSFIFGNTCYGRSGDLSLPHNLRIVAKNNIFAGKRAIRGRKGSPQSECDYNLLSTGEPGDEPHGIIGRPHFVAPEAGLFELLDVSPGIGRGVAIANFAPGRNGRVDMGAIPKGSGRVLPVRPTPIALDCHQLTFSASDTREAKARTVTAKVGGKAFSSSYRIAKNRVFDWFTVTPETGALRTGDTQTFTVTLVPERMAGRAVYKGAFLVRFADGYSCPVTVYAHTDYTPPIKPSREGVRTLYIEAERPTGGRAYATVKDSSASGGTCVLLAGERGKDPAEYRFRVPRKGKYFLALRVKSDEPVGTHDSVYFGFDDGLFDKSGLQSADRWVWALAAHNQNRASTTLQAFDLAAGEHVLKLAPRESIHVDLIAITENPGVFVE